MIPWLVLTVPLAASSEEVAMEFVRIDESADQAVGEELLYEIYRRTDIKISITPMPARRALIEASNGRKDGEALRIWSVGDRYPTLIRVPTPISSIRTQAFAKEGNLFTLKDSSDLGKYDIAIVRGVQHTADITRELMNVQVLSKMSLLMGFVREGRGEIALTGRINGLSLLIEYAIRDIVTVGDPLRELPLYHYLYEDHKHLVPEIDSIVRSMVDSGEMSALRKRYEEEYLVNLVVRENH
jgi:polar amino acid transport system substrate-binding protein